MNRILAYVELNDHLIPVGDTYVNFRRGRLTGTFSYDRGYLAQPGAYAIDSAPRASPKQKSLASNQP